jgi:hypothetical protein
LQVKPSLLRSGDTTQVYWQVANVSRCTVVGSNGDGVLGSGTGIWNIKFSGAAGKTSSPITEKTDYTLSCTPLLGAQSQPIGETVTVNVVPVFQEQ